MDVPNVTLQPACFCGMFDVVCRLTHGDTLMSGRYLME